MSIYEFGLPVEGEPESVERFSTELLEQLLARHDVSWRRVSNTKRGTIYVALSVEGSMESAAQILTDAFNATTRIVPGVRHVR